MLNVYCDMDGVLVDLIAGYKDAAGVCLTEQKGMGDEKWEPALKTPKFWEELPKMEDADELVEYLANNVPEDKRNVLTAPQHLFEMCGVEKINWINNNAPIFPCVLVVERKNKKEFAVAPCGTPNILIDDYEKNIKEWVEAGGIGIHHKNTVDTIAKLAEYY